MEQKSLEMFDYIYKVLNYYLDEKQRRDFVAYGSFTEESAMQVQQIQGVKAISSWIVEIDR